jgi:hypothetical protein
LSCDTLPNLASVTDASYDGILCWAVLMHLPEEFLFDRRIQANIERSTSNIERRSPPIPHCIPRRWTLDVGRWNKLSTVTMARVSHAIDREKLRGAVRKLGDEYVRYMLDDAIDLLPPSKLCKMLAVARRLATPPQRKALASA